MTSLRKRKALVGRRSLRQRQRFGEQGDPFQKHTPAVGREFGSPDFDRLMAEDHRNRTGVFDPELRDGFL